MPPTADTGAPGPASPTPMPPGSRGALALCCLVGLLDGLDAQMVALALPILAPDLAAAPADFGIVLAAGLSGIMLGSIACGPLADRFGRRALIVATTVLFGAFTLLTAGAGSVGELAVLRFLTGLGLGGALPNIAALAADLAPRHRRAAAVTLVYAGFPAGAVAGALIGAWLIPALGWRTAFVLGGVAPLALAPVLAVRLPRAKTAPEGGAGSVLGILAPRWRGMTLALWASGFLAMAVLFFLLSWLPSLLHGSGLAFRDAAFATAALSAGGMVGGVAVGLLVDRWGPARPIGGAYLLLGVALLGFGPAMASPATLIPMALAAGLLANAGVIGVGALAALAYPPAVRSSGVGWTLGVGRLGSIAAPLAGGVLVAQGWGTAAIFSSYAVPCALAGLAVAAAGRAARRAAGGAD